MIFSSKAEYGVRLMVELGRQTPEQPTSLKAIADVEGLPLAYLEQVVARLKKAGLVMSARGAHGGYWLSRDPADITMFDVVGALEGAIAPMECFVHDEMERVVCSHVGAENARGCATKLLWTRVQGGIVRSSADHHAGRAGRVLTPQRRTRCGGGGRRGADGLQCFAAAHHRVDPGT